MDGSFEKNNIKTTIKHIKGFYRFEPMFHQHMELVYVISGSINMSIDGIKKELTSGEMSIVFPYTVHSYDEAPNVEAIILLFDPTVSEDFEKNLLSYKPIFPYIKDASSYLPLLNKISFYSAEDKEGYNKMTSIYLSAVIGEILLSLPLIHVDPSQFNTIKKILTYCADHFTDEISIKTVSQDLYISQSNVTKIFSNKLECSFRDYINQLRIKKAIYYLTKTDMKIIDIMYACGFKNQSSFNRVFMNIVGVTPAKYRKNI